jgi:hypothetical protein
MSNSLSDYHGRGKYKWAILTAVLGVSHWANPGTYQFPLWLRVSFTAIMLVNALLLFRDARRDKPLP